MLRARTIALALIPAALLVMSGCAADPPVAVPTSSPPSPTASETIASPEPSATIEIPETFPGEIARAVFLTEGPEGVPQTSYVSTDLVQADVPFVVEGACVGDGVDFEVVRAAVGDSGGAIAAGRIACGAPFSTGAFSTPYTGPVQLTLGSTDDVTQAWAVVRPG